ncbi:DODA-type extradiol aromatic ring-opening family dioxygenase [Solimonas terrae]|uniref:Dioxygenase n=1 Tax=Solimonas terrae TaxID=1396819 RepID=A0A6M2BM61_9GAMM|nr:class III extradiol ring-cleavage dioxygenase [Solimonas terrae]NGY03686.1 dioxygenase [Solimonas terrae]
MSDRDPLRQPSLYIPHGGGPCFFMDWNPPGIWDRMADFLRGLVATLPARPRAVLLISAHWLEAAFTVGSHPQPPLIYDYYGFPEHTYQLRYGAPGAPVLAARVRTLLEAQALPAADDAQRGYDHGVFIPLKLVLPAADVPVVQLSLMASMDAAAHLAAGRALAALRNEGVLIVGSGMSFHNMRAYGDPRFGPVSERFDSWLTAAVEAAPAEREARLARWDEAPDARLSHPPRAEEHLLPLMVAAGAAPGGVGRCIFSDRVMETTVSAYRFD